MSTPGDVVRGPSEISDQGPRTDAKDADGFREELIRLAEDRDANDWDALERRTSQLLSDIRRTRPYEEDDDDVEGGDA